MTIIRHDRLRGDSDASTGHGMPTVAALLTAVGRSAVAVIGLRGPHAKRCLDACFHPANLHAFRPGQVRYGVWSTNQVNESVSESSTSPPNRSDTATARGDDVPLGESIVVAPLGDDQFEIHAHGGVAAVGKIMQSLIQQGVHKIKPEQYQCPEPSDLLVREAESILIRCSTTRNAAIAINQVRFGLSDWVKTWLAEPGSLDELLHSVGEIVKYASVGEHLVDPYQVVLAGPPNVGKSSLINRLVGFGRAITHDAPGTTRDVIACDTVLSGLNLRFSDTAGIRNDGGAIEREGIRRGTLAIEQADLVVVVISPSCIDELNSMRDRLSSLTPQTPVLEVLNQADRLLSGDAGNDELPRLRTIAIAPPNQSACDDGVDNLTSEIIHQLRPDDPKPHQAVPINQRQRDHLRNILTCRDSDSATACLHRLAGIVS